MPFQLIHKDLYVPSRTQKPMGKLCFTLIIDDFSRMICVGFLREKLDTFEKFKYFKAMVENETNFKIKYVRYDNGGKFSLNNLMIFTRNMESKGNLP